MRVDVERFLSVVQREFGARDVRLELGGKPPVRSDHLAHAIAEGWRAVVVLAEPPIDRAAALSKLAALVESFRATLEDVAADAPTLSGPERNRSAARLQESLELLAQLSFARVALVVDERSDERWGLGRREPDEVASDTNDDALVERAEKVARSAEMSTWLLQQSPEFGVLVRRFAAIYRLVLVWGGPFNELQARSVLKRALPFIERLVAELPPVDPTPHSARVTPIRPSP